MADDDDKAPGPLLRPPAASDSPPANVLPASPPAPSTRDVKGTELVAAGDDQLPLFSGSSQTPPPPGTYSATSFHVAVQQGGTPELAALQRLSPDQVLVLAEKQNALELRKLELESQHIAREQRATEQRDAREHELKKDGLSRIERAFWALGAALLAVALVLLYKGEAKLAVTLLAGTFTHLVAFFGGMGTERGREKKKKRR